MYKSLQGMTAVVCAGLVCATAGCSSSSSSAQTGGSTSATASSTASVSSAASTTSAASSAPAASSSAPAQLSAAARRYEAVIAPINAAGARFSSLPDNAKLSQVHATAGKLSSEETRLVTTLKHNSWPAGARTALAGLEAAAAKEAPVFHKCAEAASITDAKKILLSSKGVIAARVAAVAQVTKALHIPTTTS